MRLIITFCFLSILCISCKPKNLPTVSDIHEDYAEVKFSHMTTEAEMADIKTKLKQISNINFTYENSTFLEDGHLQTLKIGAEMPDGNRGSTSTDLMSLQFKYYGFEYNPTGNPSFSIGVRE